MTLNYKYGNLTIEQKDSFDLVNQNILSFSITTPHFSSHTPNNPVNINNDNNNVIFLQKFPHVFNDPYYLRYISSNKSILHCLENITNGFIYFLFTKYDIYIDLNQFNNINHNNFYYLYTHFKKDLNLEQLNQISHLSRSLIFDNTVTSNDLEYHSFYPQISKILNIFPSSTDFSDLDDLISEKSLEKYYEMISPTNNRLTLDTIISNEEFFLEYYLFNDTIKEDIYLCAQFTSFDFDKTYISDALFDLLALPLSLNNHVINNYNFKNKFFDFLQLNLNRLLIKYESISDNNYNDDEFDDIGAGDFLIQLLQNFTFEDTTEHFKFLSTLVDLVKKENPDNFYKIVHFLKFDCDNSNEILFKLIFPLISKDVQSTNLISIPSDFSYILDPKTLISNKDFIRDILFDELKHLIQTHRFTNQSPYRIYSKYNDLFDFDYLGIKFKNHIFNDDFFDQLISLNFQDLNILLDTTFERHLLLLLNSHLNNENYFFLGEDSFLDDFKIYSLILKKIQEYFQDFFNHSKELHSIVSAIYPHVYKIKKNGALKNFMDSISDYPNTKIKEFHNTFYGLIQTIYTHCLTFFILDDNDITHNISVQNIDYSRKNLNLYLELDSLAFLQAENYVKGKDVGVFDLSYFNEHKQHIEENLITHFLYSAQDAFSKSFEIKPPEKLLANMMPPVPPQKSISSNMGQSNNPQNSLSVSINTLETNNSTTSVFQVKKLDISLNSLFTKLFHDPSFIKNPRIQRFLLVFFFGNQTFEFLNSDIQNLLKKELNLFLFKNYSFSSGYNFCEENPRVDFTHDYKIVTKQRNVCIKKSYLLSSPKFAAQGLMDESFIFNIINYLPYSKLNFINTHIIPLIKLFYLNICAIFDFKISTQKTPAYNTWFSNISKVLLMELFETNFQHFNQKDLDVTDILNYLFSKHHTINIQKFKLYPETSAFLSQKKYMFYDNIENNFVNFKQIKHNQDFKKFFVLFLFMADDHTVSKVIETFYNQHQLHILHDLFVQNNILFNLNPQIFSKNILENTFSIKNIQEYITNITQTTFFEVSHHSEPSTDTEYRLKQRANISDDELDYYFNIIGNTSLLYKFGFLDKKLSLPPLITNNFKEFLNIFFILKNPLIDNQYKWFIDIFDINFSIVKDYLIEKYPSIFLFPHKEQQSPQNFSKSLLLNKEEMLQVFKNLSNYHNHLEIFNGMKNSEAFTTWLNDYCKYQLAVNLFTLPIQESESFVLFKELYSHPQYTSLIDTSSNESIQDIIKQNTFLYFWNNLQDVPSVRLSLINFGLVLNIFNSVIHFQNFLFEKFKDNAALESFYSEDTQSLYQIDLTNKYSYTAYHLYYRYICSKLGFTHEKFISDVKAIEHQNAIVHSTNKQDYLRNSFHFFNNLLSSYGTVKNKNYSRSNIFLLPVNFLAELINYYCSEKNCCHFMFFTDCLTLPHENYEKADLKQSLFDKISTHSKKIDLYQNFNSLHLYSSANFQGNSTLVYLPFFQENTINFFEFLLFLMNQQKDKESVLSLLQFLFFHILFFHFLSSTYNLNFYSILLSQPITQDFINLYKQEAMFIELDSIKKETSSNLGQLSHKNKKKI